MHVSLLTPKGWKDQPGAAVRPGATDRILYLVLPRLVVSDIPESHGGMRVSVDGVESLAVSPVGPGPEGHGLEFLVVMPAARPLARAR